MDAITAQTRKNSVPRTTADRGGARLRGQQHGRLHVGCVGKHVKRPCRFDAKAKTVELGEVAP